MLGVCLEDWDVSVRVVEGMSGIGRCVCVGLVDGVGV